MSVITPRFYLYYEREEMSAYTKTPPCAAQDVLTASGVVLVLMVTLQECQSVVFFGEREIALTL